MTTQTLASPGPLDERPGDAQRFQRIGRRVESPSRGATVGGGGKGTGPGTEFFGMKERGKSFAYVIDCSGSMFTHSSLEVAKRELLASLTQMAPDARFAIIFYNLDAKVFPDPSGRAGMMAATPSNKARVRTLLSTVRANGGTDHMQALRAAFNLHPEVIFFLTDADFMTRQEVAELVPLAGKARIQSIEFGQVSSMGGSPALKLLAKSTGGSYRYIDVNTFQSLREPSGCDFGRHEGSISGFQRPVW